MKKVTIYDIASEARTSISTVSRVLTGNAPVSKKMRERVQTVIDKYGFQPSMSARDLARQETKTLGVILPNISNPFFSTIFLEIQKYAASQDYSVLMWNSMNDLAMESRALQTLSERQVDGIIFMGGRINDSQPR